MNVMDIRGVMYIMDMSIGIGIGRSIMVIARLCINVGICNNILIYCWVYVSL
jgi:hypothetical protein